jgi:uncharacterized membrane protein
MLATAPDGETCNLETSCDAVQLSKHATTFGIKNCHYGVAIFLVMSILAFLQMKKPDKTRRLIINWGVIIGGLIALYFVYLQFFVIKDVCVYCMSVDTSMIVALIITLFYWEK